uniref:Uncharacterized protein n=1 Tax=Acrobeloides nanus TaxID=290746 RepID=A0A914EP51_9BILA
MLTLMEMIVIYAPGRYVLSVPQLEEVKKYITPKICMDCQWFEPLQKLLNMLQGNVEKFLQ